MAPVTIDDQRPKVSGSGTAAAAVPNSIGGQPVTLDAGGRAQAKADLEAAHPRRRTRPYEQGLVERLKDPAYAEAYEAAMRDIPETAAPSPMREPAELCGLCEQAAGRWKMPSVCAIPGNRTTRKGRNYRRNFVPNHHSMPRLQEAKA